MIRAHDSSWHEKCDALKMRCIYYKNKVLNTAQKMYHHHEPSLITAIHTLRDYSVHCIACLSSLWAVMQTCQHRDCKEKIKNLEKENTTLRSMLSLPQPAQKKESDAPKIKTAQNKKLSFEEKREGYRKNQHKKWRSGNII